MKKVILTLMVMTALVACGGGSSTEVKTDSSAVAVDSLKVDTVTTTPAGEAVSATPVK